MIHQTLESIAFLVYPLISSILVHLVLSIAYLMVIRLFFLRSFDSRIHELIHGAGAALPVAFLAWIIGYMVGFSRSPAVSEVVPAILTLFGTVVAFVSLNSVQSMRAGILILSFSSSFLIGASSGSWLLTKELSQAGSIEQMKEKADTEAIMMEYRRNLGLLDGDSQIPE